MNQLITISFDGTPVIDSLTIADGVEISHQAVIKIIRKYLPDFEEFGRVGFEIRPFGTSGGTQKREVAYLNEDQAMLLFTFLKNTSIARSLKGKIIKAFRACREELAKKSATPALPDFTNPAIAARAWAAQYEERLRLETKVKEDAPKVEFAEDVSARGSEMTITATAKVLGISPKKLFDWMRAKKLIYAHSAQAMQTAISRGLLVVRLAGITRTDGAKEKKEYAHVTGKGLFFLYKRLRDEGLIDRNPNLDLAS